MAASKFGPKKKVGVWIDHREAILVSMEGRGSKVEHIVSNVESRYRPSGGNKSGGLSVAQDVWKEKSADERLKHQYHRFYGQVIAKTGQANKIFIFGPGEAKRELASEIQSLKGPHVKIADVQPSDRLPEKRIVEKVEAFFLG